MLVPCECCHKPLFELRGGVLIVKVKHHGDWHTSVIPLARLVALATRQALDNTARIAHNEVDKQTTNG